MKNILKIIIIVNVFFISVPVLAQEIPIDISIEQIEEWLGLSIEVVLFEADEDAEGWHTINTEQEQTQDDESQVYLDRIAEIAKIDREDRTPDEWEELISCILRLYIIEGKKVEALLYKLQVKLKEQEMLIDAANKLIEERQAYILELEQIIDANLNYQNYLLELIAGYETKISEIEDKHKPDSIILNLGLGYDIANTSMQLFNIEVGYYHQIDWYGCGGGIGIYNALNGFTIGLFVGFGFYF